LYNLTPVVQETSIRLLGLSRFCRNLSTTSRLTGHCKPQAYSDWSAGKSYIANQEQNSGDQAWVLRTAVKAHEMKS
jgi:hypothetical protein